MHKKHGKDFLVGAMLGSTLGALTAMMFTTKKGHQIQEDLIEKYHEFEDHVKAYAKSNKRKARHAMGKIAKNIEKKIKKAERKLRKRK
ncbi:MAG TPA: YtxH domain-containing protein [Chlamydiales bacterium]|nr:YtxH domain-containing protein [Chlamydiales bacterium]